MEIIHAVWEQRNMGVDCTEITLGKNDDPAKSISAIVDAEREYTVVKVPVPMPEMGMILEEKGFRYMETMFSLRRNTGIPELTDSQKKMVEVADYTLMNEDDHQRLFSEIRKGMFNTDRVSLDPAFTREQSSERYVGWIGDEIERGTDFFKLIHAGEDAGFFAFKKVREGVFLPFLAGIFPGGPKVLGLGFALCYMEIREAHDRNARTITGSVSSNNIASLATLTSFGYAVDGAEAVYVKHRAQS